MENNLTPRFGMGIPDLIFEFFGLKLKILKFFDVDQESCQNYQG
jgi:hypothetical protein